MRFGDLFERFLPEAPISVMFRALLERALDPNELNRLFEQTATSQYTRELLFSSIVDLMSLVVCGIKPSVRSAYLASLSEITASLTAVYEKLQGLEPGVCRGLVRDTTRRLEPLVHQLDATLPEPVPGYRAKILDGNHLAATEHRIPPIRTTRAAPLPGQALVVLDPATMLVIDVAPCEDAHAQERSLIGQVLPGVEGGDLWIADRNFCTTRFLFGVWARGGCFLVRQHRSTLRWEAITPWNDVGRVVTGFVQHQMIRVTEVDGDGVMELRRIRLQLDQPTRDKETELFLLTNLPEEHADALLLAETYRRRWTLENVFQVLTEALNCEINTLAYPKAELFGFCVALVAYNVLAVIRAALRSEHGRVEVETKTSNYHLVQEVATTYAGMMIAVPPAEWEVFQGMSVGEMAEFLREAASQAWLAKYPRSKRGPKKPRPKRIGGKITDHIATARLLNDQAYQE
jgi:IS4 transposase